MSLQPGLDRNLAGGCAGFLLPLPPEAPFSRCSAPEN